MAGQEARALDEGIDSTEQRHMPKRRLIRRVALINPPMTLEERYGALASAGAMEPPYGLCYLAAVIRNIGYEVRIVDAEALGLSPEQAAEEALSFSPECIGLTATTPSVSSAARVASHVKSIAPDVAVILGGCHVTAVPEATLQRHAEFDLAVIGEGEETLPELLHAMTQGRGLAHVAGLALRAPEGILRTAPRPLVRDLDMLPEPALDLLPPLTQHYRVTTQSVDRLPALSFISSRGCYAECTFCDTNVTGNTMRAHSADYVVRFLQRLRKEYGIRCVMFEDDNFLAFRKRLVQMGECMRKVRLDMTWSCTSRVDIANAETLKLARRLGCWQVLFGVESGSQRILDFYRKKITTGQAAQAMDTAKAAGLRTKGFVIIGNPLETVETLEETRSFLLRIALDDISVTYFTPYPGAAVSEAVEQYGKFIRPDWSSLTCFEIVFIPEGLTAEVLQAAQRKMFQDFYLRPRVLFGYLGRIKSSEHARDLVQSGLGLIRHTFTRPSPWSYCVR